MDTLLIERQGDMERWTLNDPASRNALSDAMVLALYEASLRAQADPTLRIVVLAGTGRAYCSDGALGCFGSVDGRPPAPSAHDPLVTHARAAAPGAVAAIKRLLQRLQAPLPDLRDEAARAFATALRGPEAAAGLRASARREPPPWASPTPGAGA
ncbi:MAG: hypothetical protein Fur0019_01320 [Tibeticola sp.]